MSGVWSVLITEGLLSIAPDGSIWRHYERTRSGRIKRVPARRAEHIRDDGYLDVRLQINGQTHRIQAHQLVYQTLHGRIPDGLEVNHKNGRRSDNRPDNLDLLSKSGNLIHAYRELGRTRAAGERNGRHKLSQQQAETIRRRAQAGETCRGLAREYGVTHRIIRQIRDGVLWRDEYPEVGP